MEASTHLVQSCSPALVAGVATDIAMSSSTPSLSLLHTNVVTRIGTPYHSGGCGGGREFAHVVEGGRQEPGRASPGGVPAVAAAAADVPRGSGQLPGVWLRVPRRHDGGGGARGALPPRAHQEGEQGWRRAGGPRPPCRAPARAARAATDAREGGRGG